MLGLDLDSWNNLMVSALAVAALAAIVVGISTYCVIKLQKKESIEASIKISEANERTAKAELELAKLKAPRFLSTEKLQSLTNAVEPLVNSLKGKVEFAASDDAESRRYAQDFMMVFAGLGIIKGHGVSFGHLPDSVPFTMLYNEDVLLGIGDYQSGELARPLFKALESAGFTVHNVSWPTAPPGKVIVVIPPKRTW